MQRVESFTQRATDITPIIIPGFRSCGDRLTLIRTIIPNAYIPSSIVSRYGLLQEESFAAHYERLATEILEQRKQRGDTSNEYWILGRSLGGNEAIFLTKELAKRKELEGGTIHLIFQATPGFETRGLNQVVHYGKRFVLLARKYGLSESNTIYPLPESEYINKRLINDKGLVLEDTPEKRQERRETFRAKTVREANFPQERIERDVKQLDYIDGLLATSSVPKHRARLIKQRSTIISPYFFRTHYIQSEYATELSSDMLRRVYREVDKYRSSPIRKRIVKYFQIMPRILMQQFRGMVHEVDQLVKILEKSNINVDVRFLFYEHDPFVTLDDLDTAAHNVSKSQLKRLIKGYDICEDVGHLGGSRNAPYIINKYLQRIVN